MSNQRKPPRQRKTPRQRAEEALGVADRRVAALRKKATALRVELEVTDQELADAERRRDYLAQSPDLPRQTGDAPDTAP